MKKSVTIWSEGIPMQGELYAPDDLSPNTNYPVVVSAHGYTAPLMHAMEDTGYGEDLIAAGYCLLVFDYRGWGASPASVLPADPGTPPEPEAQVAGRQYAGVLDPFAWALDVIHALDFICGEPGIDTNRIGLLGSSVGGGIVFHVAVKDTRVKAIVSQMGVQDLSGYVGGFPDGFPFWTKEDLARLAVETARGGAFPQGLKIPDLIARAMGAEPGTELTALVHPDVRSWVPIQYAEQVTVPTIVLDAGDDPLWDITAQGAAVAERIRKHGVAEIEYHVVEHANHVISTYKDIGTPGTPEAKMREIAVAWIQIHL